VLLSPSIPHSYALSEQFHVFFVGDHVSPHLVFVLPIVAVGKE